ncbi:MAG: hypothetical protein PHH04_01505 [Thomasclavelia sp.]|nr:hypothetical protein [Thomasclavelia sp.]
MFENKLNRFISECKYDILDSSNPKIQGYVKELKEIIPDQYEDGLFTGIASDVISQLLSFPTEDNEDEEVVIDCLDRSLEELKNMVKSMVIEVTLEGQEDNVNRVLEVPYSLTLADLSYLVLASLRAEGSHLFNVEYQGNIYSGEQPSLDYMDKLYAMITETSDIDLTVGSNLVIRYDFGDDYTINVKVLRINDNKELYSLGNSHHIEGNGFGIWEDNHQLLDMYYDDPDNFKEFVETNGIELPKDLDDDFDKTLYDGLLPVLFFSLKKTYEEENEEEYSLNS